MPIPDNTDNSASAERPGDSDRSRWTRESRMVFLVGAPRSGTTWIQALLASHPSVATGPETHFFSMADRMEEAYLEPRPKPGGLGEYLTPDEFYGAMADLFHEAVGKVAPAEGASRYFLEKSPQHCFFAKTIVRCLPGSRFIHLVRDGRHVVASLLRGSREWAEGRFPGSATVSAQLWKRAVRASREIPGLLDNSDDYCEIRYEDFRRSPHEQLQQLFAWLDLSATPDEIDTIVGQNELENIRKKRRFESIALPNDETPGERHKEPGGFFGQGAIGSEQFDLTRLQEYQCYRVFGDLLHELGYCDTVPPVPWWADLACSWKLRSLLRLPQV